MTGDIGFRDFLEHMRGEKAEKLAFDRAKELEVAEFIEEKQPLTLVKNEMTIEELIENDKKIGLKKADMVTGGSIYHNQPNIYHLTND